ncbi:carboxylating nicotinate-nucleotide diphosphorylase [Azorhizobium doebereinerae]|uniref:carboxylating nicotinate-nucleotide diphosphorylase n=1 Tax=Azorhizobium doebereinerae TaxID=281091 RepID=UPI000421FEE8|nr:carboxylating nicotinate-nucleotide diphosphorylase [Azorhizobium doebereinerae]
MSARARKHRSPQWEKPKMYDPFQIDRLIDLWLAEDIGYCDLTVQVMIEPDEQGHFYMNAREPMTIAGIDIAAAVFARYDRRLEVETKVKDGDVVGKGAILLTVRGPARGILTAERTALNIVQRMSGIATETAKYVAAVAGTKARLIDTRKTTPGLRMVEKHAVTCGGGLNHRLGLDNGVMIKDNHIAVCGGIAPAVARARKRLPTLTKIEVECDRLDQVGEALAAGADVIMLDNMSIPDMKAAVELVAGRVPLEASGGIRLDTIGPIAQTGVTYISTSKITQSAPAVDIGLDEAE